MREGSVCGKPDCGRSLRQSQPASRAWRLAPCPRPGSALALLYFPDARWTIRFAWGDWPMFEFRDLFQWDRFITPTIIKSFYWLVIVLTVLFGISGVFSGLAAMAISPFGGFILLLSSIASVVVGVVFSRIAAEFILIVFRINEHLGAIRDQGQMR